MLTARNCNDEVQSPWSKLDPSGIPVKFTFAAPAVSTLYCEDDLRDADCFLLTHGDRDGGLFRS